MQAPSQTAAQFAQVTLHTLRLHVGRIKTALQTAAAFSHNETYWSDQLPRCVRPLVCNMLSIAERAKANMQTPSQTALQLRNRARTTRLQVGRKA
jgi:hypothetical protein